MPCISFNPLNPILPPPTPPHPPSHTSTGFAALLRPPNLRPLLIGMSLMLFQQITGQPSVLYYAAAIFQSAGFASATEATKIAVILGVFKLIMTGMCAKVACSVGGLVSGGGALVGWYQGVCALVGWCKVCCQGGIARVTLPCVVDSSGRFKW